ncbi:MAG: beta-ketoacyl synthase N-terminal-like domain-containing protein [bacterium]
MTSPIAITGFACLFPDGDSLESFANFLNEERPSWRTATDEDFSLPTQQFFASTRGTPHRIYCLQGGYIDDRKVVKPADWTEEDWRNLDPSYRWPLQVARQALFQGGIEVEKAKHPRGGLILGNLSFPTRSSNQAVMDFYREFWERELREACGIENFELPQFSKSSSREANQHLSTASGPAQFLKRELGLGECTFSIDAACASSLYAIRLGCMALRSGEVDWVLAGAVSAADPFFIHSGFSLLQAYPENNETSAPLDKNSQGLYASEGVGMVLLRRFEDAKNQTPPILGVIRGSGWSNDGKGKFVLSPNPVGQKRAYERAYEEAVLSSSEVNYLECHATGTPLGDRIEAESISDFFGENFPLLGSVKSNVGHMLTAAGMSSVGKILGAFETQSIPASIRIENPQLPEGKIVRSPSPWLKSEIPRIGAINSFGFGGTNAHLILQDQIQEPSEESIQNQKLPLYITGFEACFGGCSDRLQMAEALQHRETQIRSLPPRRWRGMETSSVHKAAFLESFDIDLRELKLPPHEKEQLIPQQLLAIQLAEKAIQDAGLEYGSKVAVLIAMDTDAEIHQFRGRLQLEAQLRQAFGELIHDENSQNQLAQLIEIIRQTWPQPETVNSFTSTIGNLMASRIAALHDFHGPAFTVSMGEDSIEKCLQIAKWLFVEEDLDGLVLVAVDLQANLERMLSAKEDRILGEGGGAIVLQNLDSRHSNKIYQALDDLELESERVEELFGHCGAANGMLRLIGGLLIQANNLQRNPLSGIKSNSDQQLIRKVILGSERIPDKFKHLLQQEPALKNWLRRVGHKPATPEISAKPTLPSGFHLYTPQSHHQAHRTFLSLRETAFRGMVQNLLHSNRPVELTQISPIQEDIPSPEFLSIGKEAKRSSAPKTLGTITGNTFKTDHTGKKVVFDHQDLLEFAGGRIAEVFGQDYAIIDSYERCVRLPLDPYLLVTRVTELEAEPHQFKPCRITTEYDIPKQAWFATDERIPWAVAIESGQCDLMLISYLGIDFQNRGNRVYRLLDCTMTFMAALPRGGQTLRYEIHIDSFARHGESLLFFFHYECFVDDQMVLRMDGGCAGFFTKEELDQGKGVIHTEKEIQARQQIQPTNFSPLLHCNQTAFEREDLLHLVQGNPSKCFGENYDQNQKNSSLRMAPEQLLMNDRILNMDPKGGAWGLGIVESEKQLRPDDWYFTCHFYKDPVMAGSLIAEGCVQLLQFYMLYLGLQTLTEDASFEPILNLPQIVRCRGQVIPSDSLMTYRLEVKEIGLHPEPYMIANIDVLVEDRIVVDFRDVGVRLVEKKSDEINFSIGTASDTKAKPAFDEVAIQNFADGSVAKCFGEHYAPFDARPFVQRNPCLDLKLLTRVLEVSGEPRNFSKPASLIAEYDVNEMDWYFSDRTSIAPLPASVLLEIALQPCGFLGAWMGSIFEFPDDDLHFRLVEGHAKLLERPELRDRKILTNVQLDRMTRFDGQVIEHFTYQLSTDLSPDHPFLEGVALFGYFPEWALERQRQRYPDPDWQASPELPWLDCPQLGHLYLLHQVQLDPEGGERGLGRVVGRRFVDNQDWYYPCHFHDDPVMPGSLGIEAALQALRALAEGTPHRSISEKVEWPLASEWKWEFRGEVRPGTNELTVLVEVLEKKEVGQQIEWVAEAIVAREGKRIYRLPRISLIV